MEEKNNFILSMKKQYVEFLDGQLKDGNLSASEHEYLMARRSDFFGEGIVAWKVEGQKEGPWSFTYELFRKDTVHVRQIMVGCMVHPDNFEKDILSFSKTFPLWHTIVPAC
jgi:hypothetical protein